MATGERRALVHVEGDTFERKGRLDPRDRKDLLGLVNDIAAFANTEGGVIEIGIAPDQLEALTPHFDSARLDDKVNSFIQPRITGLTSEVFQEGYVRIATPKSPNPPHLFTNEGNYEDQDKKQKSIFRKGDVVARHGSKTERADRSDYDRWFDIQRRKLFENVKMIFEAGPESRIRIDNQSGEAVRIVDSSTPDARPVYGVLNSEAFTDFDQELMAGVKSWKASLQTLNEPQIFKAYSRRTLITDLEQIELLLVSCWEKRLSGYYWAGKTRPAQLYASLLDCVKQDRYAVSGEALKVSSLLPRSIANELVATGKESKRRDTVRLTRKLQPVLRTPHEKWRRLLKVMLPATRFSYHTEGARVEVKVDDVNESIFDQILSTLPSRVTENRAPFRYAELICFGHNVSSLGASLFELPAVADEVGESQTES
jgi:hypothetical protein